jgi:hypothetical protein
MLVKSQTLQWMVFLLFMKNKCSEIITFQDSDAPHQNFYHQHLIPKSSLPTAGQCKPIEASFVFRAGWPTG